MNDSTQEVIHRHAVKAAGVLIALTVVFAAVIRFTGSADVYAPEGEPVASAELHFTDEPGGVVAVFDANTGARLIEYGENEGVFVRSVMRSIARQRRMRGEGPQMPVRLFELADGQLWLIDDVSGVDLYLGAFGPDNTGAFLEILQREERVVSAQAEAGRS